MTTVEKWTEESKLKLQACFDSTDWTVFFVLFFFKAVTTDLHDACEIMHQLLWGLVYTKFTQTQVNTEPQAAV